VYLFCRFEKRERFFLPVNKGLAGSDELIPVIHHPDVINGGFMGPV
jgi:hypothetical protein